MKVFQLKNYEETYLIAADTLLSSIIEWCAWEYKGSDALDPNGEIIEIPENEWDTIFLDNIEYNPEDPEDKERFTLRDTMAKKTEREIISSTEWLEDKPYYQTYNQGGKNEM